MFNWFKTCKKSEKFIKDLDHFFQRIIEIELIVKKFKR